MSHGTICGLFVVPDFAWENIKHTRIQSSSTFFKESEQSDRFQNTPILQKTGGKQGEKRCTINFAKKTIALKFSSSPFNYQCEELKIRILIILQKKS